MAGKEIMEYKSIEDLIQEDIQKQCLQLEAEIKNKPISPEQDGPEQDNTNTEGIGKLDTIEEQEYQQLHHEYLENLKDFKIPLNKPILKRTNIINTIKNLDDINKINEDTLGDFIDIQKIEAISNEHYSYIAENIKMLLSQHLQRNPNWTSPIFGGKVTGIDLNNISISNFKSDRYLKELENIKKKNNIDAELDEILNLSPEDAKNKKMLNIWLQSTLTNISEEEKNNIILKLYDKIPNEKRPYYFFPTPGQKYLLEDLKEGYMYYKIKKANILIEENGETKLNSSSKDFFANFESIKIFCEKGENEDLKKLADEIQGIRDITKKLKLPQKIIKEVSLDDMLDFLTVIGQQFDQIKKLGEKIEHDETALEVNQKRAQGILYEEKATIREANNTQTQLEISKNKCIINIEKAYAKLLLSSKYPPKKGEIIPGITQAGNLDFTHNDPEDIVRDGIAKRARDAAKNRRNHLGEDIKADIGGVTGMIGGILGSVGAAFISKNIFVTSAAFTAGLSLGNGLGQEATNLVQLGIEKTGLHTFEGKNKTRELFESFRRGVGILDQDFNEIGREKFSTNLLFDYAANVATFGISRYTGGMLKSIEGLKGIGGALKFGVEEIIVESFLVDIPVNIFQTGVETFFGIDDKIIKGNTLFQNKKGENGQRNYQQYNFGDMLDSMINAGEENLSVENLTETFCNTILYGGILEGSARGIKKIKKYHPSEKINILEIKSAEISELNKQIQGYLKAQKLQFKKGKLSDKNGTPLTEGSPEYQKLKERYTKVRKLDTEAAHLIQDIKEEIANTKDIRTKYIFQYGLYSPYNTPLNILHKKQRRIQEEIENAKNKKDTKKQQELEDILEEYNEVEKILTTSLHEDLQKYNEICNDKIIQDVDKYLQEKSKVLYDIADMDLNTLKKNMSVIFTEKGTPYLCYKGNLINPDFFSLEKGKKFIGDIEKFKNGLTDERIKQFQRFSKLEGSKCLIDLLDKPKDYDFQRIQKIFLNDMNLDPETQNKKLNNIFNIAFQYCIDEALPFADCKALLKKDMQRKTKKELEDIIKDTKEGDIIDIFDMNMEKFQRFMGTVAEIIPENQRLPEPKDGENKFKASRSPVKLNYFIRNLFITSQMENDPSFKNRYENSEKIRINYLQDFATENGLELDGKPKSENSTITKISKDPKYADIQEMGDLVRFTYELKSTTSEVDDVRNLITNIGKFSEKLQKQLIEENNKKPEGERKEKIAPMIFNSKFSDLFAKDANGKYIYIKSYENGIITTRNGDYTFAIQQKPPTEEESNNQKTKIASGKNYKDIKINYEIDGIKFELKFATKKWLEGNEIGTSDHDIMRFTEELNKTSRKYGFISEAMITERTNKFWEKNIQGNTKLLQELYEDPDLACNKYNDFPEFNPQNPDHIQRLRKKFDEFILSKYTPIGMTSYYTSKNDYLNGVFADYIQNKKNKGDQPNTPTLKEIQEACGTDGKKYYNNWINQKFRSYGS